MVANETALPKSEVGSSERFPELLDGWYPACLSRELPARRPMSVVVYGRQFVIYRTDANGVYALVDRCPHRNVPLSQGRVCTDGTIECPYHGWRFAGNGACREVPGLEVVPDRVAATATAIREAGGLVWIWAAPETAPLPFPSLPEVMADPRYTTVIRHVTAPASLYRTVENALDVPHTSVLHRGLFRSGARQQVRVIVRRFADRAEAEYQGERPPRGVLAWLLALGLPREEKSLTVEHWDRFILPSTAQVEYRLGQAAHFVITAYARPVSAEETELFAVASFRTGLPGLVVRLGLEPFARWVFGQDQRMLGLQTRAFKTQGAPNYYSTALDTLGQEIWRLLKSRSRKGAPAETSAEGHAADPPPDASSTPQFQREFELWA